jgi:hypothetical protein
MKVVSQKACKWCRRPMSNVAEIAPFGGGPGLVAFMCSHCGTTDSVLTCEGHPAHSLSGPFRHIEIAEPALLRSRWTIPKVSA